MVAPVIKNVVNSEGGATDTLTLLCGDLSEPPGRLLCDIINYNLLYRVLRMGKYEVAVRIEQFARRGL